MAISDTGVRITYYANGTVIDYTFPFRFIEGDDLEVYVDGEIKSYGIDYNVSPITDDFTEGGIVTFVWVPGNGSIIVILRAMPATQETHYSLTETFNPSTLESDLDKRAMVEQQLLDRLARCLIFPMSEDPPNRELPAIADRAGEGLIFDVDGNIIAGSFYSGDPASTWGKTLIDDADASEGRTTLGLSAALSSFFTSATLPIARQELGLPEGEWTVSTAAPSGTPADGDVWIRREP